jgi:putative transcriptional regulator
MFIVHIIKKMRAFVMRQDQVNMKLKLARVEKNLTQQDLADRVNVARQTIGLIEKGKYNPSINLCINIAKVLNKSLDQLFWEE